MREEDERPDAPTVQSGQSRARASVRPTVELARRFAELLEEPESHQLVVSARCGIPWTTYKDWMSGCVASATEFRAIVLEALDKRRRADLADMAEAVEEAPGTHAATILNMRKFRHEGRFKRFYKDDEPTKLELTGKDGGAVELDLRSKSVDDLVSLMLAADQVKRGKEDDDANE